MQIKRDEAIILRLHQYGESDLIVSLFTKEEGKKSGIAKGARKSKKRFGGALEIGSHVVIGYEERPHRELVFLKETELVHPNPSWRKAWETIAVTGFVLELVAKSAPEHQSSLPKFDLLGGFLKSLQKTEALSLLLAFQREWLSLSGWGDHLEHCGICGHVWENIENGPKLQKVFDHYWHHLFDKPLISRKLLDEAVL